MIYLLFFLEKQKIKYLTKASFLYIGLQFNYN